MQSGHFVPRPVYEHLAPDCGLTETMDDPIVSKAATKAIEKDFRRRASEAGTDGMSPCRPCERKLTSSEALVAVDPDESIPSEGDYRPLSSVFY